MLLKHSYLKRIKSSRDFQNVYNYGKKYCCQYFFTYVRDHDEPYIRYGVTVTRRIGNAVVRNRAKRIMREALRQSAEYAEPGFEIVLVARSDIKKVGFFPVLHQLKKHLFEKHSIHRKGKVLER